MEPSDTQSPPPQSGPARKRLDSWKEIASYFQRDVRTAKRWEKDEGLPVHRHVHAKQATVYAYQDELDAWWNTRRPRLEGGERTRNAWGRWSVVAVSIAAFAAGSIVTILTGGGLMRSGPPEAQPVRQLAITLPASAGLATTLGTGNHLALSPDGATLVYVGADERLYRRAMDQSEVFPIRDTEGAQSPFFSPDGQWVGFRTDSLKKVSLAGGAAVTICRQTGAWRGASWSPDGTILFSLSDSTVRRIPDTGHTGDEMVSCLSAAEVVTQRDEDENHYYPSLLPGGRGVLMTSQSGPRETTQVAVYALETGEQTMISEGAGARFVADHIVFARQDTLWAMPFDADRLEPRGEPVPLLEGVQVDRQGQPQFAVAEDASLTYLSSGTVIPTRLTPVWVDREGSVTSLGLPPGDYSHPVVSPDGAQVSLSVRDSSSDIWMYDVVRGTFAPFVKVDDVNEGRALWTPDGSRVTFYAVRRAPADIYWQAADQGGNEELLLAREHPQFPVSWLSDGHALAFEDLHPETGMDIWILSVSDKSVSPFLVTAAWESRPMFSHDGRWIAYSSDESGQTEVYVSPYADRGGPSQVSTGGGWEPRWSPAGRELLYMAGDGRLMAVEVETELGLTLGSPRELLRDPNYVTEWDMHPDGKRFLMLRREQFPADGARAPAPINIVLNWIENLPSSLPTP